MVDYSLASKVAPFQAPNLLALAAQGQQMAAQNQQMQTNMLAAQKFRQDLEMQNALRQKFAEGGLDLNDPRSVNTLGQLGGLEAALKVRDSQRQGEVTREQVQNLRQEREARSFDIKGKELDLLAKHGGQARSAFAQILELSRTNPEQAAAAYDEVMQQIRKSAPGIASQFSPTFSPEAARNSIFTLEQLQQRYAPPAPKAPVRGTVGGVDVVFDESNPALAREVGVVPFGGGIPGPREATPAAPAAMTPPEFGGLGGTAALRGGQALSSSELAARKRLQERGDKIEEARLLEEAKLGARKTVSEKEAIPQIDQAISELRSASAKGGLIEQSTGSGLGSRLDTAAGFFGVSTKGAEATAKLQPIADIVLKLVPRFEGPQSNADVTSYQKASGDLANPSLPSGVRVAAAKELIRLMEKRRGQFGVKGADSAEAATAKSGQRVPERTGTYNGRRVVQYSDGTTEYAD